MPVFAASRRIRLGLALATALLASGCLTTGPTLDKYPNEASLENALRLPSELDLQMQGRTKVVVLQAEHGNLQRAREAQAEVSLTHELEALLHANGVEIVDRSLAGSLDQELKLAEIKGLGSEGGGPMVASYVLKPSLTQADYERQHTPAQTRPDKKDKNKTETLPAFWTHSAQVSLTLRVHEIPSLRLVKTLTLRAQVSQNTPDSGAHDLPASLIRRATQQAMKDAQIEFPALFPINGYILGKRSNDKQSLLRASIGSAQGLAAGNVVQISSERETVNPITQKPQYHRVPEVQGVVSRLITANEAWIQPDDEGKVAQVRLGERFEVMPKAGRLDSLRRAIGSF